MTPDEYKTELENISNAAGQHAEVMERKEYTNRAELQRDMAVTLELWQKREELLAQVLEDDDIFLLIDYKSEYGAE